MEFPEHLAHYNRYLWKSPDLIVVTGEADKIWKGRTAYHASHAVTAEAAGPAVLLNRLFAAAGLAAVSLAQRAEIFPRYICAVCCLDLTVGLEKLRTEPEHGQRRTRWSIPVRGCVRGRVHAHGNRPGQRAGRDCVRSGRSGPGGGVARHPARAVRQSDGHDLQAGRCHRCRRRRDRDVQLVPVAGSARLHGVHGD